MKPMKFTHAKFLLWPICSFLKIQKALMGTTALLTVKPYVGKADIECWSLWSSFRHLSFHPTFSQSIFNMLFISWRLSSRSPYTFLFLFWLPLLCTATSSESLPPTLESSLLLEQNISRLQTLLLKVWEGSRGVSLLDDHVDDFVCSSLLGVPDLCTYFFHLESEPHHSW